MDAGEGRVIPAVPGWLVVLLKRPRDGRPLEWPVIGWRVPGPAGGIPQPVTPFGTATMGVWRGRVGVYRTPGGAIMDHYGRNWEADEHDDMFRTLWRAIGAVGPAPEAWGLKS